ncbi:hypothetical protein CEY02_19200 [Bacillus pumilus]|uniref:Uncharacterized protein n=1 Tax=Bacillus pumilus TaxID=1408 RepID=A0A2A5IMQ7_BACPU|nr:hypothetical protein [Bacillus pumilus]PCK18329.1 hypothetical protein CEY02_19200 [Bacillus pumilus]
MEIRAAVFDIKVTCNAYEGFNKESASEQREALEVLGNTIKGDLLKNGVDDVKIKGYFTEQLESDKRDMKFFEVNEPYSALIKARTKEKAMQIYTDTVADDDGNLSNEITEVTDLFSAICHSRTVDHDGKQLSANEVFEQLTNDEEMLLSMDRSLQ